MARKRFAGLVAYFFAKKVSSQCQRERALRTRSTAVVDSFEGPSKSKFPFLYFPQFQTRGELQNLIQMISQLSQF